MGKRNFVTKTCIPCTKGASPLTPKEIREYVSEINTGWKCIEDKKIQKKFSFPDFVTAMKFINRVADIAEQQGHHPDTHIFYNKVTIELSTHSIGGLSENDFIVAAKIDAA